jgi:hypothetical protein
VRTGNDLPTYTLTEVDKTRSLNLRIPKGLLRPVAGKTLPFPLLLPTYLPICLSIPVNTPVYPHMYNIS